MTSDKATAVEQRLNAMWTGDSWNSVSLTSNWSGSLHYRYGMDNRHVILKFQSNGGGGGQDAGQIAVLPAAYRPNNDCDFPLTVDQMAEVVPSQSPHIHINASDGTVHAYGISTGASYVALHAVMAIYDDPV